MIGRATPPPPTTPNPGDTMNTDITLATIGIVAIFVLLLIAAIADGVGLG